MGSLGVRGVTSGLLMELKGTPAGCTELSGNLQVDLAVESMWGIEPTTCGTCPRLSQWLSVSVFVCGSNRSSVKHPNH